MKVFLLVILCSAFIAFGQNKSEFNNPSDSVRTFVKEPIAPPIEIKPSIIVPLRALNSFPLSLKLGLYSFAPIPENNNELNTDLLYPSLGLNESYKLSFLYNILGAAQAGAVGYLAYKHIKKFGLFK